MPADDTRAESRSPTARTPIGRRTTGCALAAIAIVTLCVAASSPASAQARKAVTGGVDLLDPTLADASHGTEGGTEAAEDGAGLSDAEQLLVAAEEARVPIVASEDSIARDETIGDLLNRLGTEFASMSKAQFRLLTTRLRRSSQLALTETKIMRAQASMLQRELDTEARNLRRRNSRILAELHAGRYSPAEARDAVRELAAEARRYDELFQEAVTASQRLGPRLQMARDLEAGAINYAQALATAEDSALGQTIDDLELLDRTTRAVEDLAERVATAKRLDSALADVADTCAKNAALAADGLVAIHDALTAKAERGLFDPVPLRLTPMTLTRAGKTLAAIPGALAGAFVLDPDESWLDVLPTQLLSLEDVAARVLAAVMLLVLVAVGWRVGPAKLRASLAPRDDEPAPDGAGDTAVLLASLRAVVVYAVGLGTIALLALTPAWAGLMATAVAWAAVWVLWSGALGAAGSLGVAGEADEARALGHGYQWGGALILWSGVCITVLRGLSLFYYPGADVICALQLLYAVVACGFVLILVGQQGGPLAALPRSTPVVGRLRRAARPINVTVGVASIALLGALLAGYASLAVFFASRLAWTILVVAAAVWGHLRLRALLTHCLPEPEPLDTEDDEEDDTLADEIWVQRALYIGQATLVILIAAVLIGRLWGVRGWHVAQATAFLSQPVISVKGTSMSVVSVLKGILVIGVAIGLGRWLRSRLVRSPVLALRWDAGVRHAIAKVTYYCVVLAGAAMGLHVAGLQLTALAVFAGMMGIAVGFGSQHIASNFIAGIILTFDRSTDVGDYIEVGGQQGTITHISLRATTIRTPDNKAVVIPNSSLLNQNVVGTTQRDWRVRMLLEIIVAGDSDPDKVGSVLKETAAGTEGVLRHPGPEVWITKLATANLTFQLAAWTDQPQHQDRIRGVLTAAVGRALKENEIALA